MVRDIIESIFYGFDTVGIILAILLIIHIMCELGKAMLGFIYKLITRKGYVMKNILGILLIGSLLCGVGYVAQKFRKYTIE